MSSKRFKVITGSIAFRAGIWLALVMVFGLMISRWVIAPNIHLMIIRNEQQIIDYKLKRYIKIEKQKGYPELLETMKSEIDENQAMGIMVQTRYDPGSEGGIKIQTTEKKSICGGGVRKKYAISKFLEIISFYSEREYGTPGLLICEREDKRMTILFKEQRLKSGLLLQVGKFEQFRKEREGRLKETINYINVFLVLMNFVFGVIIIRFYLRPLGDLIKTMGSIHEGEIHSRVMIRNRSGEMGQLANLFNRMLSRIETLILKMKQSLDNVAHDLRTPLSRMRLTIENAIQKDDPELIKEALLDCAEESGVIESMLNTLMDISEAETGTVNLKLEEINLSKIIQESIELYDHLILDKFIEMQVDVPDEILFIADRNRIRQVISNLLDNAIKYSEDAGIITIKASEEGDHVTVNIRDEGIGIAKDNLNHIFERLYRADKSRTNRGLGLGLSLVQAVVHAHKGDIYVESVLGKGSEFIVILPTTIS